MDHVIAPTTITMAMDGANIMSGQLVVRHVAVETSSEREPVREENVMETQEWHELVTFNLAKVC